MHVVRQFGLPQLHQQQLASKTAKTKTHTDVEGWSACLNGETLGTTLAMQSSDMTPVRHLWQPAGAQLLGFLYSFATYLVPLLLPAACQSVCGVLLGQLWPQVLQRPVCARAAVARLAVCVGAASKSPSPYRSNRSGCCTIDAQSAFVRELDGPFTVITPAPECWGQRQHHMSARETASGRQHLVVCIHACII